MHCAVVADRTAARLGLGSDSQLILEWVPSWYNALIHEALSLINLIFQHLCVVFVLIVKTLHKTLR